jgi:hypothetical protein
MKYLSDYTEKPFSIIFKRYGAFFAFSNEQFNEQRDKDLEYTHYNSGMFVPTIYKNDLNNDINEAQQDAINADIKDNGIDRIIKRETIETVIENNVQ